MVAGLGLSVKQLVSICGQIHQSAFANDIISKIVLVFQVCEVIKRYYYSYTELYRYIREIINFE